MEYMVVIYPIVIFLKSRRGYLNRKKIVIKYYFQLNAVCNYYIQP